tara:strand:+ start:14478 stop:14738 length:261 start_codon:yes stop_codon:yes gene_type:complete
LRLDVRRKVIRNEVVVAVFNDAVDESREFLSVAKGAVVDVVEDNGELGIELVVAVEMGVSEVLDIFCEVAEEEDIVLADFTGDFNL